MMSVINKIFLFLSLIMLTDWKISQVQCEAQIEDVRINDSEDVEMAVDTSGDYLDQEVEVEEVELNSEADAGVDLDNLLQHEEAPTTQGFFKIIADSIFLSA